MTRVSWVVDPDVPGVLTFGRFGMAQHYAAITGRLTTRTTVGNEAFLDESGAAWRGIGMNVAAASNMPLTDASAQNEAALVATRCKFVRRFTWDGGSASGGDDYVADGSSCTIWSVDPGSGAWSGWSGGVGGTFPIDATGLLNFVRFTRRLRENKVRGTYAIHDAMFLRGMGYPETGGDNNFPHRGLLWTPTNLAGVTQYLTYLFGLSCSYSGYTFTGGIGGIDDWGHDPFWHGVELQNEYSAARGWSEGNAGGTDGWDRAVADGNTGCVAEIQTAWATSYGANGGAGGSGSAPQWPMKAYVDGTHALLSSWSTTNQDLWYRFLPECDIALTDAIKTLMTTIAPDMLVCTGSGNYGPWPGASTANYGTGHFYQNTESTVFVDPLPVLNTPTSAWYTITAASLTSNVLSVTSTEADAQARFATGGYVKLLGITPSGGTDPNGDRGPITVSGAVMTVPLTAADVVAFTVTGAELRIAANLGKPGGDPLIQASGFPGMGEYLYQLTGRWNAGQPFIFDECAVKGNAEWETTHPVALTAVSMWTGASGWADWSWSQGTAYFARDRIIGDEDAINKGASFVIGWMCAQMLLWHVITDENATGTITAEITPAAYATRVRLSGVVSAGYTETLTTADYERAFFNEDKHNLRLKLGSTDTFNASTTSLGSAGTDDIYNAPGGWVVYKDNDGSGKNNRMTCVNARRYVTTGVMQNETLGPLTISNLDAAGEIGTIGWVTTEASDVEDGTSAICLAKHSANSDFVYADAASGTPPAHQFYTSYGTVGPEIEVPDCTLVLDMTGKPEKIITAVDANGVETTPTGVVQVPGVSITITTGNYPMYIFENAANEPGNLSFNRSAHRRRRARS